MDVEMQENHVEIPVEMWEHILGQAICQHFHTHVLIHPEARAAGIAIGFPDFWSPIAQLASVSRTFRTIVSDIVRTLLAPRANPEDLTDEQKYRIVQFLSSLFRRSMRLIVESHRQLKSLIIFRKALHSDARFSEPPPWPSPLFTAYGYWFLSLQSIDFLFATSYRKKGAAALAPEVAYIQKRNRWNLGKVFKMAGGNHRFLEMAKGILVNAVIGNELGDEDLDVRGVYGDAHSCLQKIGLYLEA